MSPPTLPSRAGRIVVAACSALALCLLAGPASFASAAVPPPVPPAAPSSAVTPADTSDPGAKRNAPAADLQHYPKRTDVVGRAPIGGPVTEEVRSERAVAGDEREVTIYTPAPGVTPSALAARLRSTGDPGATVARDDGMTPMATSSTLSASSCASGSARTFACPVAFWANNGYADPQVWFNDHTGSRWPVDKAVYVWNQAVGIDSYYRWNSCPSQTGVHCVNLYNKDYGATGWAGLTTVRIRSDHRFVDNSTKIQFNDHYSYNADGYRQDACHEIGHALGLGHNKQNSGCLWFQIMNSGHRSPENDDFAMLRSLYSVRR